MCTDHTGSVVARQAVGGGGVREVCITAGEMWIDHTVGTLHHHRAMGRSTVGGLYCRRYVRVLQ